MDRQMRVQDLSTQIRTLIGQRTQMQDPATRQALEAQIALLRVRLAALS